VASIAAAHGFDPFTFVMASIAALLAAGAVAFTLLPGPDPTLASGAEKSG
jgi:hypothetical protein